jgi:hypothetical protein
MPTCLHPKLLSICHQCYAPPGFNAAAIGWATGESGPCGTDVDSALVGRIGRAIVVACRGTLAPGGPNARLIIDDWINNAETGMVPWPDVGAVHDGFFESHRALWPSVREAIIQRSAAAAPSAIIVTGHSKGGALAVLGAAAIRRQWPGVPVHVVTFAAPRAGGQSFADRYKTLGIPTLRYENRADLVPYLPLGGAHPAAWSLLKALGVKRPVTGYVGVGEAFVSGPGFVEASMAWAAIGWRLLLTRSLKSAVPLIAAHAIDGDWTEYSKMAQAQAQRCAADRHVECLAAGI